MSLTQEQEIAAYASASAVVNAGAGTGKTHMLAERYLYYLRDRDYSPLELVAVTFTKKAATELRSRIRNLVSQQLPERKDLIAELEAAQISTIHNLAARICREHPEQAEVPPDFQILDNEGEAQLWLNDLLQDALAELPLSYYQAIPYSLMKDCIWELLNDPWTAQKALNVEIPDPSALARELRAKARDELLNHPQWEEVKNILYQCQGKAGDKLEEVRQLAIGAIVSLEEDEELTEALTTIDKEVKCNKGSKKNWKENELKQVKDALTQLREELIRPQLKKGLINLEPSAFDEQLQQTLPILKDAYQQVSSKLQKIKQQARLLSFTDLEIQALKALQEPQVRDYYQSRWQVFLIDEFQDTNPTQAKLFNHLTQNTDLTIVGDKKQSIYGFRGAEVTVFDDFRDRVLNHSQGTESLLSHSFRTHEKLIQEVNRIFSPLFNQDHQSLTAHRRTSPNSDGSSFIQAFAIDNESPSDSSKTQRRYIEASQIAQTIQGMLSDQTPVWDKETGQLRPIEPSDIAILTRTWEPLTTYGETLAAYDIPSVLKGGGNLLATREAKDASVLLRFLADPNDDMALIALLRSPFFGISDRLLFQLAPHHGESKAKTWWERVETSQDSYLASATETLQFLLAQRNQESPSRLLQIADHKTGYTAVLNHLSGSKRRAADWQGFRGLVQQLEQGNHDLFAVMRRLKQFMDEEVEIPRPPIESGNAVSLMTIFSAKGLEWPMVVVADLTRSQPSSSPAIYFNANHGVALKLKDETGEWQKPVLYRKLENLRQQKEEEEAKRILYVALTRARDYLVLTASDSKGNDLDRLKPGLEAANIAIRSIPFDLQQALPPQPSQIAVSQLSTAETDFLLTPSSSGIFELPVTALTEYASCPKRFQFQFLSGHPGLGETVNHGRTIGTLVHQALEQEIQDLETLACFAENQENLHIVEEALDLAETFRQSSTFESFRGTARAKEYPITLTIAQVTLNGIADLIGEDWVLDYKTDQEINPKKHRLQLWAYAKALGVSSASLAYLRHDQVYTFNDSELVEAEEEATTLINNLQQGNYIASPSENSCSGCPYYEICEDRYTLESSSFSERK